MIGKAVADVGGGAGSELGESSASAARSLLETELAPVPAKRSSRRPLPARRRALQGNRRGARELESSHLGAGTPLENPRLSKCRRCSTNMWSV